MHLHHQVDNFLWYLIQTNPSYQLEKSRINQGSLLNTEENVLHRQFGDHQRLSFVYCLSIKQQIKFYTL